MSRTTEQAQGTLKSCEYPLFEPMYIMFSSMPRKLLKDFNYMFQIRHFPRMLCQSYISTLKNKNCSVYWPIILLNLWSYIAAEVFLRQICKFRHKRKNILGARRTPVVSSILNYWPARVMEVGSCEGLQRTLESCLLRGFLTLNQNRFLFTFRGWVFADVERITL
jgi:hypothetical protein